MSFWVWGGGVGSDGMRIGFAETGIAMRQRNARRANGKMAVGI